MMLMVGIWAQWCVCCPLSADGSLVWFFISVGERFQIMDANIG